MVNIRTALALAAGLAMPLSALAIGPLQVIYSKKPGHPTAVLPGSVDMSGNPVVAEWKAMEDLFVSSDGARWIMRSRANVAAEVDTGFVMGSGTTGGIFTLNTASGNFVMQEGRPAPFGAAADWIDFMPTGFGRFDSSNNLVFGIRARTSQTGAGASADANRVIKWNGTTGTLAFKQGDLYTNLQDAPPNPSGDETVGNSVGSYHLLNDGRVGTQDTTIINIHSSRRPALTYNRDFFQQINVSNVNPGAFGAPPFTWIALDANEFYTTPDGAHWYAEGRITATPTPTTADDGVLSYDGTVVIREGSALPGSSMIVGDILQTALADNGHWISRGRDSSGTGAAAPDWATRNGTPLAKTGEPITPGSNEHWGDSFYAVAINTLGDYLIVGNTDAGPATDGVVVLNGTQVLMREGDAVDLNGNGQFDDDAFIGRGVNTNVPFNANTWFITDDHFVYGLIMLRDGAGNDITTVPAFGSPQAFVRMNVAATQVCYPNCDNSTIPPVLNIQDFTCFINRFAGGESYANCDNSTVPPVLNIQDFSCFLNSFAVGCT